jgi:RNA recognition motif-containing protein
VSTTLYVSNLPFTATEETLLVKFGKFGTVVSVKLNRNVNTGNSERTGFVEMQTDAQAQSALNWLNFADFDGRLMSVIRAVAPAAVRN